MRTVKMIVLSILFACVSATLAQAGSQVKINSSTIIKAAVKNTTTRSTSAAIKLTGYNNAGVVIGSLCKSTWLSAGKTTYVEFPWTAPNYATGIYWSSKVEVSKSCPTTVVINDDHDDDDHDDHDDDHDDDDHDDRGDD